MPNIDVQITSEPIDTTGLVKELRSYNAGAIATFEGTVRSEMNNDGRLLSALDYSAYEEMALDQMRSLCERAIAAHGLIAAAIIHRLGRVPIGEPSIAIVTVSAHRAAALEACRWLIDTVKLDVPIWKKEVWAVGESTWSDPLKSEA